MPTMKTRLRPRPLLIVAKSCSSLPMAPSVRKTTWRRCEVSEAWLSTRAARIGGIISVPPLALSRLTKALARSMFSLSAGTASANNWSIVSSKRMTLKWSPGFIWLRP